MSYQILLKPLAELDINESYTWYNEEREGLGDDFLSELEKSQELIREKPYHYQVRYKEVRMVQVKRFSFCLHYTIEGETIIVHAVLSTDRNPRIWKKRS